MKEKHEDTEWLFGGENGDAGEWEADRRFISEEFNAIYRQGVIGPHHLREADFAAFLVSARERPSEAAEQILAWKSRSRPQGGDFGELAMERLSARAASFDAETACGLVRVFADVMDDYDRQRPSRDVLFGAWEQTESILRSMKASVPGFDLGTISEGLAQNGKALSWMISAIGRSELWAQGLVENQRREDRQPQLSEVVLRSFLSVLFHRVSKLKIEEVLALPNLGRLLFTLKDSPWHKAIARRQFTRLAGPRTGDDVFISFLEGMAGGVISSNRGSYYTISTSSIHSLIGADVFERRWSRLKVADLGPELSSRLRRVEKMMADSRN
jgi:hypothetical protein